MRAAPAAKDRILRLVRHPWQSAARNFGNAWNLAGQGNAGRGWAWLAKAWQGKECGGARRGTAWRGRAWQGKEYGKARLGAAGQGLDRRERGKEYGSARPGVARLCGA